MLSSKCFKMVGFTSAQLDLNVRVTNRGEVKLIINLFEILGFYCGMIICGRCTGQNKDGPTDYGVHGTPSNKVFRIFLALGTIAFSFGDAMLPEIQVQKMRISMIKDLSYL